MNNFEVRIFSPDNLNEKWYVYIYHNSKIIKKIYKGINSENSFEERMLKAETLKNIVEKEIKEGWNPNTKKKSSVMTLFEALDFGLDKKKSNLAPGSYGEYSIAVNLFKDYGAKEGLKNLSVIHCDKSHIKAVLASARIERNWSAMNYNKTLRRLSSIFSELIEWDITTNNPTRDIRPLKEDKTGGYRIMTDKEQKKIFTRLQCFHFNYYIFCSIIYYMGIRITELLKLKCEDVDLENGIIIIKSTDSKNKKIRIVPIIGTISKLLQTFDLSNDDNYLFGVPIPGKLPSLKPSYFAPNKYQIKRAYPTNIWQDEVILGLEIDVKLYANKHKGGSDKLKAGIDIDTISNIFGHSKTKITELYADYIKDLRFEKAKSINLDEY